MVDAGPWSFVAVQGNFTLEEGAKPCCWHAKLARVAANMVKCTKETKLVLKEWLRKLRDIPDCSSYRVRSGLIMIAATEVTQVQKSNLSLASRRS